MNDSLNTKAQILFGTDLHYLSPSLTDRGECFTRMVENADGKLPERSDRIVGEFLEIAVSRKPDAVIIAGDLTFNGERISLTEFAEKLKALKRHRIPVLVIPGNHDIACPFACRYEKDKAYLVKNVSQEEFRRICGCLGYDDALSRCPVSFSYIYELPGKCRILMMDTNTQSEPGRMCTHTLTWAREELRKAKELGIPVIGISHQNVLRQNRLLYDGFVIRNEEEVKELLLEGKVKANFSGHSHIRHFTSHDSSGKKLAFTDYAVGCMTVYPLSYAWIEVDGSGNVRCIPLELSSCREEAQARFDVCSSRQVTRALEKLEIPAVYREEMIRYAVKVNKAYFSGKLDESFRNGTAWNLWRRYAQDTYWFAFYRFMTDFNPLQ